jgi:hypothetical protein
MRISNGIRLLSVAIAAMFVMTASHAYAQDGHQHQGHGDKMAKMDKTETVTLEGEVVDLYCFMKHPENGQGPDHAKCAKNCINKGLPIGFLVDDEVYLIVGKEHESAAELVVDFAGAPARLKGTAFLHHGVKAIEFESIEKL